MFNCNRHSHTLTFTGLNRALLRGNTTDFLQNIPERMAALVMRITIRGLQAARQSSMHDQSLCVLNPERRIFRGWQWETHVSEQFCTAHRLLAGVSSKAEVAPRFFLRGLGGAGLVSGPPRRWTLATAPSLPKLPTKTHGASASHKGAHVESAFLARQFPRSKCIR